jgi:hypothetical protein
MKNEFLDSGWDMNAYGSFMRCDLLLSVGICGGEEMPGILGI